MQYTDSGVSFNLIKIPQYDPSSAELLPTFAAPYLLREDTLMSQYIHRMDEADLALTEWWEPWGVFV